MEQARQIAALEDTPPVLITGETGTGKGLIAHTIHASGPRSSKPFIEVNCTALPASLMEAELFGHERGAFTDAKQSKLGLFEAAERGFIFLDEIGDTELPLQGKLLRAIEERMVRRVGGIRDRKIDVRILAATNRDLEREAQAGTFRRDLYFRLAVILLRLPPLRDRGDDVLLLADDFMRRYSAKYGKDVKRMSTAARDAMLAYSWPGNVRELSHVIERAVLWSQSGVLEVEQLSLSNMDAASMRVSTGAGGTASTARTGNGSTQAESGADAGTPIAPPIAPPGALPPRGTDLAQWEKSMIEQALREANGNQTQAAQRLGVSRDTLRYRLKKFGIQ
jgi:two-component system response regulator AtoC